MSLTAYISVDPTVSNGIVDSTRPRGFLRFDSGDSFLDDGEGFVDAFMFSFSSPMHANDATFPKFESVIPLHVYRR